MDIRPARLEDAAALREIYNHEVEHSTVTFDLVPRTLEEQRAWLAQRSGALAVLVAEIDGEVAGFASLSPYKDRPAYRTTVESSVYVGGRHRRKGVASALMAAIVEAAQAHGFHAIIARIVGGHEASIALHEQHGFEHAGLEREVGRKFGRWLDVVTMQRML